MDLNIVNSFPDLNIIRITIKLPPRTSRGTAIPNPSLSPSTSGPVPVAAAFVVFVKDVVEVGEGVIVGVRVGDGVG